MGRLEIPVTLSLTLLMSNILKPLTLFVTLALLLVACGVSSEPPPLAEAGQPTLVFIYTDN